MMDLNGCLHRGHSGLTCSNEINALCNTDRNSKTHREKKLKKKIDIKNEN